MKQSALFLCLLAGSATALAAPPSAKADLCAGMKKAIAASSERPPFTSLKGAPIDSFSRKAKLSLPGFGHCVIENEAGNNPSLYCETKGLGESHAQALLSETRGKVEKCFGKAMFEDYDRSGQPLSLRMGAGQYPMIFAQAEDGAVVVGYVSDYRPPR
jgi:hypothetical protein